MPRDQVVFGRPRFRTTRDRLRTEIALLQAEWRSRMSDGLASLPGGGRTTAPSSGCRTLRHECLDNVVILNERHVLRILGRYVDYYNRARTHLSLSKDSPDGR